MRLVITGASGFIGQLTIPLLHAQNITTFLVGRSPEMLAQQFPDAEIGGYDTLAQKGRGADALLHLAVLNNDQSGTEDDFKNANVTLLEEVIAACRVTEIPRLIYTSSLQAGAADTSYGRSKAAADSLLSNIEDLTLIQFRLPAVYGDQAFKGKLGILNKVPAPLRDTAFQILRSLKPTVHANKIANAVHKHIVSTEPVDEILTDCQEGNWFYAITKKLIDLAFALSVIVFFWWLLLIVWIAVKLTSKGPGILAQERVGRFGKPFTLYKFRTMQHGTKQAGTHEVSAATVTSVGTILRKTKIDELPQVWNILKGEISLVGPRPCLPVQTELVEERRKRGVLDILPGISGYAQMRGVDMSNPVKLSKLDAEYIKLRTAVLDMITIVKTGTGGGNGDRTSK